MRYFSTYLIPLLCLVVVLVGAYIQVANLGSIALARSGAVIVCLGMIRAFLDLTTTFKEIDNDVANGAYPRNLEDLVEGMVPLGEVAKARAENIRLSLSSRTARVDLAILIAGTLLWGFGDLVPALNN